MKRHLMHLTFIVCLAALVAAAPAAADVTVEGTVEGTGEPAYTNSTGNTQWIRWQAPADADAYRLHARYTGTTSRSPRPWPYRTRLGRHGRTREQTRASPGATLGRQHQPRAKHSLERRSL